MSSQRVTKLHETAAKNYFLKDRNYVSIDLPPYLHFDQLLTFVKAKIGNSQLSDLCKKDADNKPIWPSKHEDVNYKILSNKDGAYSWRPLELIHPVLYIDLVNLLTEKTNWEAIIARFDEFSKSHVHCIGIPRESTNDDSDTVSSIKNWWEKIEQESLRKALEFNYIYSTDIADCYGSIYTHSIEWALHPNGKAGVKADRLTSTNTSSLGRQIDSKLQNMNHGQTNGLPQGSALMDFLAEIVLGYADIELTKKLDNLSISKDDFYVLRYRDDYRILTNNPSIGHAILRELNQVLYELGLKMHPGKTKDSDDVITFSLKPEKIDSIVTAPIQQYYQKEALRIYQLSRKYPNAGLILKELQSFFDRVDKAKHIQNVDFEVLISIFTMIAIQSPRTISWCAAIISKLLEYVSDTKHIAIVEMIIKKFSILPNVGLVDLWLQRISAPLGVEHNYKDKLTELVTEDIKSSQLWNCEWLDDDVAAIMDTADISDLPSRLSSNTISPVIEREEVELFRVDYTW
jgi:RNA-directed DNA polymerase